MIGSNLKAVETLVKKNIELKPILEYLKSCNIEYSKQLEIVKIQLESVSKDIETFKIFYVNKKLKQVAGNFDLLDKQQEEFRKFNFNTQKYTNNVSSIATELFQVLSSVNEFSKTNLLDVIHSEITQLKSINNQINKITMHINEELSFINSTTINKLFLEESILIKDLYVTSKNIFEVDKFQYAFNAIQNKIKESLKEARLPAEIRVKAIKKLDSSQSIINGTRNLLKHGKFDDVKKIFISQLLNLEDVLSSIKADEAYQVIYNKYFNEFKTNISSFYEVLSKNNINNLYKQIIENFSNDNNIKRIILSNIEIAKNVHSKINNFNSFINRKEYLYDIKTAVKYIMEIYEQLLFFKIENDELQKLIHVEHKNFFSLIIRFNELDFQLLDLKKLVSEYKINNQLLIQDIETNIEWISKIKDELITGRKLDTEALETKANSINKFIITSVEIIKTEINLISIIKRLKLYSNRYYKLSTKQQLEIFDDLYKKQQYQLLIEEYIQYIQKMKKQKRVS
ncbi:MAG: hypothetical protein ACRC4L_00495 [Mycoplasma sp.]